MNMELKNHLYTVIEKEIHLNQTSTILGSIFIFQGIGPIVVQLSHFDFPSQTGCQEGLCATCFAKALPRLFKCFNYFSSPFWFTFLKTASKQPVTGYPSFPQSLQRPRLSFGGPPFCNDILVIGGRVTLNHQLWLPGNRQLSWICLRWFFTFYYGIHQHQTTIWGICCFFFQPPNKQIWVRGYTIWIMDQPSLKLIDPLYMNIMSWMVVGKHLFLGGEGPWSYRKCRNAKNSGAWRMGSYT